MISNASYRDEQRIAILLVGARLIDAWGTGLGWLSHAVQLSISMLCGKTHTLYGKSCSVTSLRSRVNGQANDIVWRASEQLVQVIPPVLLQIRPAI